MSAISRWRDSAADVRAWLEDPQFLLTPGQRYTAVIVAAVAVLMISIGVPHGGHASIGNTPGVPQVQPPASGGR